MLDEIKSVQNEMKLLQSSDYHDCMSNDRSVITEHHHQTIEAGLLQWSSGKPPEKMIEILELASKFPEFAALPLVLAQERQLVLDMEMEVLLHERAEMLMALSSSRGSDNYKVIHAKVMGCLRSRLSDAAARYAGDSLLEEEAEEEKKKMQKTTEMKAAKEKRGLHKKRIQVVEALQTAQLSVCPAVEALSASQADAAAEAVGAKADNGTQHTIALAKCTAHPLMDKEKKEERHATADKNSSQMLKSANDSDDDEAVAAAASPAPAEDDGGFGMNDLAAALEASMQETKRPKQQQQKQRQDYVDTLTLGQPQASDADWYLGAGGDSAGVESGGFGGASLGPGTGLRNLTGEYNCFLNVVIQSLWHLPPFSKAVQAAIGANVAAAPNTAADPYMALAGALREVFAALDLTAAATATTAATTGTYSAHGPDRDVQMPNAWASPVGGADMGRWEERGGRAGGRGGVGGPPSSECFDDAAAAAAVDDEDATAAGFSSAAAVAPTALRKALAVLTGCEGLFAEKEMADASEALQVIFEAVHRAVVPRKGSKFFGPVTQQPPPPPDDPKCPDWQSSSAAGLFLDQECGYSSVVHRCFGLDVEVRRQSVSSTPGCKFDFSPVNSDKVRSHSAESVGLSAVLGKNALYRILRPLGRSLG